MLKIANFSQANQALQKYVTDNSGQVKYTLENMTKFMNFLGNPQNRLKIVHVAGTSGKTSTCYYVASLLSQEGYKTGLTVSPHIDQINERVQVNLVPIPEAKYCFLLAEFLELVESSEIKLSHFEVMVAFAYWVFDKEKVDYAVVEVGLGGLLDGTNVVNRDDKICVITDIGLDHTEILGSTLGEIAYQKAGIIHENNTVFMNSQSDDVVDVVRGVCNEQKAVLNINTKSEMDFVDLPNFQKRNLSLAVACVNFVLEKDARSMLSDENISDASQVYIPGRMEIVNYKDKTLILDGSHSSQKVSALVSDIQKKFPGKKISLLASFGQNKESSVTESVKILKELGDSIITTCYSGGQDEKRKPIDATILAQYANDSGFNNVIVEKDPAKALEILISNDSDIYLVTGSLYLLNDLHSVVTKTT